MNCHERLATEGQLKLMEEKLFMEAQRLELLRTARETVDRTKKNLHRGLPADHAVTQSLLGTHHLLVLECGVLSSTLRTHEATIARLRDELAEDDNHMMASR